MTFEIRTHRTVTGILTTIALIISLREISNSAMTPTATLTFSSDQFLSSPAIASDGTVYIAGIKPDVSPHANQRRLYAINPPNPNMTIKWTAYVGTRLSTSSDLKFDKGGECSPAIASDGTIYIGSWDYKLYAITTNGTTKWVWDGSSVTPKGVMRSSPVIGPDGKIYCFFDQDPQNSSSKSFLAKFQDNGTSATRLWYWDGTAENPSNPIKGNALASPALGRDGVIYIATHDEPFAGNPPAPTARRGWLYAIDATSDTTPLRKWTFPGGNDCVGPISAGAVIDANGRLYIATKKAFDGAANMSPEVISIDPTTGNTTTAPNTFWAYATSENPDSAAGGPVEASLAMNSLGQLLVPVDASGTPASRLIAFDSIAAAQDWVFTVGGLGSQEKADSAPIVAADGSVFIKILSGQTSQATLFKLDVGGNFVDSGVVDFDISTWHGSPFDTATPGIDAPYSSIAIASDGKLYCAVTGDGSNGGKLFCFSTGITGYSFWSKFRGNQYNTGNAQDNKWTAKPVASVTASISPRYSYPSTGNSAAYAINRSGVAAGYEWNAVSSPRAVASIWSSGSSIPSQLNPVSQYSYGYTALGLNDSGAVVGSQTIDASGNTFGYFWSSSSANPAVLVRPTGYSYSEAVEISRDGVAAGSARVDSSGRWHAMRWDTSQITSEGTDLLALGSDPTILNSYAYGISPWRNVVGKSQSSQNGVFHAFVTQPDSLIAQADNLSPGGDQSEAHAINGIGQIVGSSTQGSVLDHAWVWLVNKDGSISPKDLGTLGGNTSRAIAINNRGHVVGWSYKSNGALAAFIWVPGWSSMRELRSFLSTTDQNSWTELSGGYGIGDDGTVVGYGRYTGIGTQYTTGFAVKPNP